MGMEEHEDLVSQKSAEEQAKAETSADFTNFPKSLSGIRILHSKAGAPDPKKKPDGDEPDSMSTTLMENVTSASQRPLTSIGNSSLGKLLLEDEPRPKTRFQRLEEVGLESHGNSFSRKRRGLKEEESILFDDDSNDVTASSTASQEGGEPNDLLFDDEHGMIFADVSLSDSDEVKADVVQEGVGEEGKPMNISSGKSS